MNVKNHGVTKALANQDTLYESYFTVGITVYLFAFGSEQTQAWRRMAGHVQYLYLISIALV